MGVRQRFGSQRQHVEGQHRRGASARVCADCGLDGGGLRNAERSFVPHGRRGGVDCRDFRSAVRRFGAVIGHFIRGCDSKRRRTGHRRRGERGGGRSRGFRFFRLCESGVDGELFRNCRRHARPRRHRAVIRDDVLCQGDGYMRRRRRESGREDGQLHNPHPRFSFRDGGIRGEWLHDAFGVRVGF